MIRIVMSVMAVVLVASPAFAGTFGDHVSGIQSYVGTYSIDSYGGGSFTATTDRMGNLFFLYKLDLLSTPKFDGLKGAFGGAVKIDGRITGRSPAGRFTGSIHNDKIRGHFGNDIFSGSFKGHRVD